jgi:hypothetical protein
MVAGVHCSSGGATCQVASMDSMACAVCGAGIASKLSRALAGIVSRSLCWQCSRPAYQASGALGVA